MITDDTRNVSALRAALAERIGQERLDLWFGDNTRLAISERALSIDVPSQFFRKWIGTNFRGQIEDACRAAVGKTLKLNLSVDETLGDIPAAPAPPEKSNGSAQSVKLAPSDEGARSTEPKPAFRRKFACLESFVAGEGNQLAYGAAKAIAREPGQYSPLMIYGPTGVGKTHLIEGIWSSVRKRHDGITPVYLSAEQFTTQFLEALRGSGLPNFRRKCRGVGLLIIDDLQFLVGKRATQVELMHTVDTLMREGRQMVFTADRPPSELADFGPELTSRLQSGMTCRIESPDYATRLGIVAQMARRLRVNAPDDVQQFVASRLTNHARELSGALCRLQATGEALQQPITLQMAEQALADMVSNSGHAVGLGDIERAVCDVFGVEPSSLQSNEKAQRVSHPRMLAMWLARKHTRAALSEIGQFFGRRSHSTVLSAQKRVDNWMASNHSLRIADGTGAIDDAIRRVERRLKVG